MDTVARHPLTALCVVAVLVALALHLGIDPPDRRAQPATRTRDSDEAEVDAESVGKTLTVYGSVTSIDLGGPDETDPRRPISNDRLSLAVGGQEAVCSFPIRETSASPLSAVRTGEPAAVLGRVERVEAGRVYLAECKLIPLPKLPPPRVPATTP